MTSSWRSMVDVCRYWADTAPERVVYSYLSDGEALKEQLTFGGLDARAQAIAARLQRQTSPGDRALLLYPTGVEYIAAFMGCLYAGVAAVPAYPIHGRDRRWKGRLDAVLHDAAPRVALATAALRDAIDAATSQDPAWNGIRGVMTDDIDPAEAGRWRPPAIASDTLAFLQYTSGTTSAPRGVMVGHGNLAHQEALIQRTFHQHAGSVIVSWLPLYHDMGLIGSVLQTLYAGAHCVLMSPAAFLQKPGRWLQAIQRFSATTSGGPNFAYDLCASKVGDEDRASLDLSSWEVAFNGAEAVRADTMRRFGRAFAPCGFRLESFRPCYGLAESTLMVTSSGAGWVEHPVPGPADGGRPSRPAVSCGAAGGHQTAAIVDPGTLARCADGVMGEVWVHGDSVAMGYWRRERETRDVFRAVPAGAPGAQTWLRTGDLGFQWQGQLFLAGRLKDLIIVRGRNHLPEDIERSMERAHPALRPDSGIACEIEQDGEACLLVVQEIATGRLEATADEIISAIRVAIVADHGITPGAIALVGPRSIPRTPSGKKQRRLCAQDFLDGRLGVVASSAAAADPVGPAADAPGAPGGGRANDRRALEAALVTLAARALGIREADLTADVPLTQVGADSLRAIELQAQIELHLRVRVPVGAMLDGCSIAQLIDVITAAPRVPDPPPAAHSAAPDRARLSEAEKAMWFLHELASGGSVHTIARAGRLEGAVDWDTLSGALRAVTARHEALRTTFPAAGGQPWARVHDTLEPHLEHVDVAPLDDAGVARVVGAFASRPFSLEDGPLVRLGLFSRSPTDHVLAFVIHHIAADLWSVCTLLDELGRVHAARISGAAPALPAIGTSYRDHLADRERRLAGPEGQRLQAYWHAALAGMRPTELPTDRPRSSSAQFLAVTEHTEVDAALVAALAGLGAVHGATLYAVLLAAFQVLVHAYTRQADVVVGSPFHGRHGAGSLEIVGCLTNLLALRADLGGDPTFAEHLAATRSTVLGALDHQEYPFPRLVESLRPRRDPSRMPLCNVVFVYQSVPRGGSWPLFAIGAPGARLDLGTLQLTCLPAPTEATAFDLTVTAAPCEGALAIAWNYRTDLLDGPTVRSMAGHFCELLRRIAAEPGARLSQLAGQMVAG